MSASLEPSSTMHNSQLSICLANHREKRSFQVNQWGLEDRHQYRNGNRAIDGPNTTVIQTEPPGRGDLRLTVSAQNGRRKMLLRRCRGLITTPLCRPRGPSSSALAPSVAPAPQTDIAARSSASNSPPWRWITSSFAAVYLSLA